MKWAMLDCHKIWTCKGAIMKDKSEPPMESSKENEPPSKSDPTIPRTPPYPDLQYSLMCSVSNFIFFQRLSPLGWCCLDVTWINVSYLTSGGVFLMKKCTFQDFGTRFPCLVLRGTDTSIKITLWHLSHLLSDFLCLTLKVGSMVYDK